MHFAPTELDVSGAAVCYKHRAPDGAMTLIETMAL